MGSIFRAHLRSMSSTGRTAYWAIFALATILAATVRSHLDGDGAEYLMMAHAFATHGSASLTLADFAQVGNVLNGRIDPAGHKLFLQVVDELGRNPPGLPYFGFARTASGEIYSIHFWAYSLMAAPFYAIATLLGIRPTLCFPLLNLALLAASILHLRKSLPRASSTAAIVFLSLGTIYYLRWTGPEVLTACCAFSATICVLRRDTGLAIFLAGLGATQNPSLALIIPLIGVHRLAAIRLPALATLPLVARGAASDLLLIAAGIVAALSPYAFYYNAFGVPSLIAPYFTDLALVTPRRALSLLFDLNQGMVVGIPGVFIGLAAIAAVRSALDRQVAAANALFALVASCLIAAPALAAINWNSGALVMLRYAYWAAMPLVAYLVSALPAVTFRTRLQVVSAVMLVQCLAVLGSGLMWRPTSYVHHAPLAEWAFAAFPAQVNPDPEIFIERGKHSEASITFGTTQVFYANGVPVKLLRHWTNGNDSGGACPEGQQVSAQSVVEVDRGWEYLNAPLACTQASQGGTPLSLRFAGTDEARAALGSGWAGTEPGGTWTNATRSVLRIRVPAGRVPTGLFFTGHYFNGVRASDVRINGKPLGMHSLSNGQLEVPDGKAGEDLLIELRHADAATPAQLGLSGDTRLLAFYLGEVKVRLRTASQVGAATRAM